MMRLNESTDSASSGQFETVFPVIRGVFAKLLANELVSVQALNLPLGKLYYINPKISVRKDGVIILHPMVLILMRY